eukprot:9986110-Ditylum_brightwellii.AAC.1
MGGCTGDGQRDDAWWGNLSSSLVLVAHFCKSQLHFSAFLCIEEEADKFSLGHQCNNALDNYPLLMDGTIEGDRIIGMW